MGTQTVLAKMNEEHLANKTDTSDGKYKNDGETRQKALLLEEQEN